MSSEIFVSPEFWYVCAGLTFVCDLILFGGLYLLFASIGLLITGVVQAFHPLSLTMATMLAVSVSFVMYFVIQFWSKRLPTERADRISPANNQFVGVRFEVKKTLHKGCLDRVEIMGSYESVFPKVDMKKGVQARVVNVLRGNLVVDLDATTSQSPGQDEPGSVVNSINKNNNIFD
jgi:membrane protein implicated in regulation of membrane protease activity